MHLPKIKNKKTIIYVLILLVFLTIISTIYFVFSKVGKKTNFLHNQEENKKSTYLDFEQKDSDKKTELIEQIKPEENKNIEEIGHLSKIEEENREQVISLSQKILSSKSIAEYFRILKLENPQQDFMKYTTVTELADFLSSNGLGNVITTEILTQKTIEKKNKNKFLKRFYNMIRNFIKFNYFQKNNQELHNSLIQCFLQEIKEDLKFIKERLQ